MESASIGIPHCLNKTDRQINPVPGIPGVPTDSTTIVNMSERISAGESVMPNALAKNKVVSESMTLRPSMLMVAPKGIEKE